MAASSFVIIGRGGTALEAFQHAKSLPDDPTLFHGSIKGKLSFTMIDIPTAFEDEDDALLLDTHGKLLDHSSFAYDLLSSEDPRVTDRNGPCGCYHWKNDQYVFVGIGSNGG